MEIAKVALTSARWLAIQFHMAYVVRVVLAAREGFSLGGFTGTVAESLVLRPTDPSLHGARPKPFSVTPLFVGERPVVDLAVVGPGPPGVSGGLCGGGGDEGISTPRPQP